MSTSTMSRQTFEDAVAIATPGTRISYHIGLLMEDRCRGPEFLKVDNVAHAAFKAFEAGTVHLTQRRLSPNQCEYIAVKRSAPFKTVKFTGCYDLSPVMSSKRVKVAA